MVRLAFLSAGPALLSIAIGFAIATSILIHRGVVTKGTVIANEARRDVSDGSTQYFPRFVFATRDGRSISVVSDTGTNPASFREGQTVDLIYIPSHPENARIHSFVQLWFMSLMFAMVGAAALAMGLLISGYERSRAKKLMATA
jgi:hypothetical protein